DDGRRYEIHDGELSVTPAPNPRHQRLVGAIYRILFAHVRSRGLGEVLLSPIDVILSDIAIVQPDVVYLERSRAGAVSSRGIEGTPTLAVEILSLWTVAIDRQRKHQLYARYGVPFYWIVDAEARSVEARARARGVRAGRTGRRRGTGGAAAARRSGARRGGSLARGSGGRLDLRTLAVGRAHLGLDPAAHVEVPDHLDPARLGGRHEVVQNPVRHVLVERALVPVRPEVELERLELDQVLVGHVADADRREIGLAGPGAGTGELRHRHRDLVVPLRVRVRH